MMQGIVQKILENPGKYSLQELQRAMQDGVLPAYIAVPLIQQKSQEQKQMQSAQQAQQAQSAQQAPVAQQIMQDAAGISALPSNLPSEGFAGGGIVAFDGGGVSSSQNYPRTTDGLTDEEKKANRYYGLPEDYDRKAVSPWLSSALSKLGDWAPDFLKPNAYNAPQQSVPQQSVPQGAFRDFLGARPDTPVGATSTGTPAFTEPSPPTPAAKASSRGVGAGPTVIPSTYFPGASTELTPEQQYENALALSQRYAPKGDDDYAQALKALSEKRASRIEGMESTAKGLAALQAAAAMGKSLTFGQGIGAAAGAFGSAYGAQKQRIEAAQDAADSAAAEYQKYKTALSEGRRKEAFTAYEKATDNAFQAKKLGVEAQYYADANRAKMMEAQAHLAHYGNLGNLQDRQEKMQTLQDLRALSNNLATEIKTLAADISKNPAMDNSENAAQLNMLRGQLRTVNSKLSELGGVTLPEPPQLGGTLEKSKSGAMVYRPRTS